MKFYLFKYTSEDVDQQEHNIRCKNELHLFELPGLIAPSEMYCTYTTCHTHRYVHSS